MRGGGGRQEGPARLQPGLGALPRLSDELHALDEAAPHALRQQGLAEPGAEELASEELLRGSLGQAGEDCSHDSAATVSSACRSGLPLLPRRRAFWANFALSLPCAALIDCC